MKKGIVPTSSMLKSELLPAQPVPEEETKRLLLKDVFEEFMATQVMRLDKRNLTDVIAIIT